MNIAQRTQLALSWQFISQSVRACEMLLPIVVACCLAACLIKADFLPGYKINYTSLECSANPVYFTQMLCDIHPPHRQAFSTELTLRQQVGVVGAFFEVSIPNARKKMTKIFNSTWNVCKSMQERKKTKLADVIYQGLSRKSNLPRHCPFKKIKYYFRNISGVSGLPPMLCECEFMVSLHFFIPKVASLANYTVNGHLIDLTKEHTRTRTRRF